MPTTSRNASEPTRRRVCLAVGVVTPAVDGRVFAEAAGMPTTSRYAGEPTRRRVCLAELV